MRFISILIALLALGACTSDITSQRHKATDVAIIMPLSGKYGNMGKRASALIEMGLEDGLKGTMKVVLYDISEDYKMDAAASKIRQQGAQLVLGPIFSPHTLEMSKRLEGSGASIISLSNNSRIAGKNLYVFGHSPTRQTRRIFNFLLDQNYKDFMMLLPVGRYYSELSKNVSHLIESKGGRLYRSEFYVNKESSIDIAIENIAKIAQSINELEENSKKPVLYISDEPSNLKRIMKQLKNHNLDLSTIIVGDNKIDLEYETQIPYIFTGSIKYNPDDILTKLKSKIPDAEYIDYMDLMAYDLGRIVSYNLGRGLKIDQFKAKLDLGHLYLGVSGDIKFVDHIAYRKYDIVRRSGAGYEIIDRAR